MKVRELMTTDLVTADARSPVRRVAQRMAAAGIRHMPVVKDGALVGIISERDVIRSRNGAGESRVADIMEQDVEVLTPDDDLETAAARMATLKIGSLPVVEEGELKGIVTATDLLARQGQRAFGARPDAPVCVGDVMTNDPDTARPEEPLLNAASRLLQSHIRHLPVVEDDGRLVGILSDRDVRNLIGEPVRSLRTYSDTLDFLTVGEAMSGNPMTTTKDEPITNIIHFMVTEKVGALPVVDETDHLVGIVSYVDILLRIDTEQ